MEASRSSHLTKPIALLYGLSRVVSMLWTGAGVGSTRLESASPLSISPPEGERIHCLSTGEGKKQGLSAGLRLVLLEWG